MPNYAQTALGLEQKLCTNEGGRVLFIERRARLAWHHATRLVMMPRELCSCHMAILSFHASPPSESSSVFARVSFFDQIFEGSFGGLLVLKMGHAAYRLKAIDVFFPTV